MSNSTSLRAKKTNNKNTYTFQSKANMTFTQHHGNLVPILVHGDGTKCWDSPLWKSSLVNDDWCTSVTSLLYSILFGADGALCPHFFLLCKTLKALLAAGWKTLTFIFHPWSLASFGGCVMWRFRLGSQSYHHQHMSDRIHPLFLFLFPSLDHTLTTLTRTYSSKGPRCSYDTMFPSKHSVVTLVRKDGWKG